MRVVSLVPSITETLLAWGVEVIACTRFCEQPGIAHVGGTKDPAIDAIVALRPDLVVVDREENRREDAVALETAGLTVHVTHVVDVADVAAVLDALAAATGATVAPGPPLPDPIPAWASAAVLIWRRPWMALGPRTYGSSLLAHLGVDNVLTPDDGTYPGIDLADLARRRPDLVVLPSEPYPFAERHRAEVAAGVPGARVVLVDGRDLFWWGMRTEAARARLGAMLGR